MQLTGKEEVVDEVIGKAKKLGPNRLIQSFVAVHGQLERAKESSEEVVL